MSKTISFLLLLCLFICFVLLLLVSISTPIIKGLYLVIAQVITVNPQPANPSVTEIRFGIWGFCANRCVWRVCSVGGFAEQEHSAIGNSTFFTDHGECIRPHLGYQLDPAIMALTGHPLVAQQLERTLTAVFVLHPISAGLVLLALIFAIPASRSKYYGILALLIQFVAASLTTAVLAVDFTLIAELMDDDGPLASNAFDVDFGNCPWIVLGATLLIWFCVGISSIVVCNCCGCGRKRVWEW